MWTHVGEIASNVAAWQTHHNVADRLVDWQFTTGDTRLELRKLYPVELEEDSQDYN